jgi:hypothetical protein
LQWASCSSKSWLGYERIRAPRAENKLILGRAVVQFNLNTYRGMTNGPFAALKITDLTIAPSIIACRALPPSSPPFSAAISSGVSGAVSFSAEHSPPSFHPFDKTQLHSHALSLHIDAVCIESKTTLKKCACRGRGHVIQFVRGGDDCLTSD